MPLYLAALDRLERAVAALVRVAFGVLVEVVAANLRREPVHKDALGAAVQVHVVDAYAVVVGGFRRDHARLVSFVDDVVAVVFLRGAVVARDSLCRLFLRVNGLKQTTNNPVTQKSHTKINESLVIHEENKLSRQLF